MRTDARFRPHFLWAEKPYRRYGVFYSMMPGNKNDAPSPPEPLVEGVDYYIEKGYWVFTEHFLLKRGQCCGSGCRHCPYRKKKKK
ncbi:MAG: hypothetical protein DYG98_01960 [Haliscomenobacteraceae bacterium CHB4]|nr:hypothetical protein [Haliscomenobacteraceae bacterium CHB4]